MATSHIGNVAFRSAVESGSVARLKAVVEEHDGPIYRPQRGIFDVIEADLPDKAAIEMIAYLLGKGYPVVRANRGHPYTVLHAVVDHERSVCLATFLLENGADVHLDSTDCFRLTPVMVAARRNRGDLVQLYDTWYPLARPVRRVDTRVP